MAGVVRVYEFPAMESDSLDEAWNRLRVLRAQRKEAELSPIELGEALSLEYRLTYYLTAGVDPGAEMPANEPESVRPGAGRE